MNRPKAGAEINATNQLALRVPSHIRNGLERIANYRGHKLSDVTRRLLDDGINRDPVQEYIVATVAIIEGVHPQRPEEGVVQMEVYIDVLMVATSPREAETLVNQAFKEGRWSELDLYRDEYAPAYSEMTPVLISEDYWCDEIPDGKLIDVGAGQGVNMHAADAGSDDEGTVTVRDVNRGKAEEAERRRAERELDEHNAVIARHEAFEEAMKTVRAKLNRSDFEEPYGAEIKDAVKTAIDEVFESEKDEWLDGVKVEAHDSEDDILVEARRLFDKDLNSDEGRLAEIIASAKAGFDEAIDRDFETHIKLEAAKIVRKHWG